MVDSILDRFAENTEEDSSGSTKESLSDLMKDRYLGYARDVIMNRALPDVRDGLKPVHRRILYTMYSDLMLKHDERHRKSAAVVGSTLGTYHPHGDIAVYHAMVRMSQAWKMRVPLVDGHGNFGSLDGDGPAAMRYTEARPTRIVRSLMLDLKKETVPFSDNYDNTTKEPDVLPASFPMLLVNGSQGIAVGVATSIPPHNPSEVIDAAIDLLENPGRRVSTLVKRHIKGPDFPTGGTVVESEQEMIELYKSGRGSVTVRSAWYMEQESNSLIITEVPYGVDKQRLIEEVAQCIIDEDVPGLNDIIDESTDEVRVVLKLASRANVDAILAYLCKHTCFESSVTINLTCLVPTPGGDMAPTRLDIKQMLQHFLDFRMDVVTRRLTYDLGVLEDRIHILDGFTSVLDEADHAVKLVMGAKSKSEARQELMDYFDLDHDQAEHVLNRKIYRLASYEAESVREELKEKRETAQRIEALVNDRSELVRFIIHEMKLVKDLIGSPRKTKLGGRDLEYDETDFIESQNLNVIVSRNGWVRTQKSYSDVSRLRVRDGDEIGWALSCNTKRSVLFFTNKGKVYTLRANELPLTTGYGEPIQSMVSFDDGEQIIAVFSEDRKMLEGDEEMVAVSSTAGRAVRFNVNDYMEPSTVTGRTFMRLEDGDEVVNVEVLDPDQKQYVVLVSKNSRCLAFEPSEIRLVKNAAKGVETIDLQADDCLVAFGLTSEGTRGDSLSLETGGGGTYDIRHSTHGVTSRKGKGRLQLKRASFKKWNRQVVVL